ncbi:MAG: hypothetical protein M0011_14545 [Elusimicrobia bacterium]|nr:hypothetical protein [Elusimicrobiota bacterium]
MDNRIVRLLIYIFSGLIAAFSLLMLVNYLGTLTGERAERRSEVREEEEQDPRAMAAQAMAAARAGSSSGSQYIPYRSGLSTSAAVTTEGGIRLVKDRDFNGVAEKPQGMMDMLNEMGGGRKKPSPVKLEDSDLDRKMRKIGEDPAEQKLKAAAMPELGRGAGQEGVTLLTAPVDFKVFKSSETWWAFSNSHKCRYDLRPAPAAGGGAVSPDFSRERVLVLVSLSDLPNGIFRITGVGAQGGQVVVSYKVDPMAMSAASDVPQHDFYSASVVPARGEIKLSQVP